MITEINSFLNRSHSSNMMVNAINAFCETGNLAKLRNSQKENAIRSFVKHLLSRNSNHFLDLKNQKRSSIRNMTNPSNFDHSRKICSHNLNLNHTEKKLSQRRQHRNKSNPKNHQIWQNRKFQHLEKRLIKSLCRYRSRRGKRLKHPKPKSLKSLNSQNSQKKWNWQEDLRLLSLNPRLQLRNYLPLHLKLLRSTYNSPRRRVQRNLKKDNKRKLSHRSNLRLQSQHCS